MFGLFSKKQNNKAFAIPEGQRVYTIGDIHGRLDLLERLSEKIVKDIAEHPSLETTEIYLGDYIDRGPKSAGVIDWLTKNSKMCDRRICLRGNHELYPLSFLSDERIYDHWRNLGGRETLISYGIHMPLMFDPEELHHLQQKFIAAFPPHHAEFIANLEDTHIIGDYFFVHAGARPGVPLDKQKQDDLLWIRDDFLHSRYKFSKMIVHGHTPVEKPEIMGNRMNIDTGAYTTNKLTCIVLENTQHRFIHT
ncbi:MAG: metallophosphoesterase family protein [Pseudomonadota bacterium]